MKKLIRITTVPISLKILLKDQLKFLNKNFEVIAISSNGKELLEVEEQEGVRTIPLNMTREITPIQDFISLLKMIYVFFKEKPDIVHTHTPKAGIIGMLASWICRVPYRFHTVAGLPVMESKGLKKKLLLFVEKCTYLCATNVYPNSKGLMQYIVENKLSSLEKLKLIGFGSSNGIDSNYFEKNDFVNLKAIELKNKYEIKDKFVFSFIGRIVKDKGVNELIFAFNELSKVNKNVILFLIGDFEETLDPISCESKDIINKNKMILSVGFQNDIRHFLAISDCFVFPSYREGFPNVVLQACCMEVPSIVSNINGCNEIISNNVNGLIIKTKCKNELYLAMKKILQNRNLILNNGVDIREEIIKKYDRQKFFKYLIEEYRKVIQ